MSDIGYHNLDLEKSRKRLEEARSYEDLSTIIVTPTRGEGIHHRVVNSWMGLMKPMNQKVYGPVFVEKKEVGAAYQAAIEMVLSNPELSTWQYILTLEEDNCPPPDGLLKLYESMNKYDAVEGLYWTKGEAGQPMCYGDPKSMPKNFIPQIPPIDKVKEYNGLGMGFTLFKLDMFKRLQPPWFRTVQENGHAFSQDLWFFDRAGREGFHFACDSRVKVGHFDANTNMMW